MRKKKEEEKKTEANASNNGLVWKYNRMTSSFVNMLPLQLQILSSLLLSPPPTRPSSLLLPQLICKIEITCSSGVSKYSLVLAMETFDFDFVEPLPIPLHVTSFR